MCLRWCDQAEDRTDVWDAKFFKISKIFVGYFWHGWTVTFALFSLVLMLIIGLCHMSQLRTHYQEDLVVRHNFNQWCHSENSWLWVHIPSSGEDFNSKMVSSQWYGSCWQTRERYLVNNGKCWCKQRWAFEKKRVRLLLKVTCLVVGTERMRKD